MASLMLLPAQPLMFDVHHDDDDDYDEDINDFCSIFGESGNERRLVDRCGTAGGGDRRKSDEGGSE